tara:strand:+ start:141 stop:434 length:294 start_codon:yes stop_codon:yes gene_type:complete
MDVRQVVEKLLCNEGVEVHPSRYAAIIEELNRRGQFNITYTADGILRVETRANATNLRTAIHFATQATSADHQKNFKEAQDLYVKSCTFLHLALHGM